MAMDTNGVSARLNVDTSGFEVDPSIKNAIASRTAPTLVSAPNDGATAPSSNPTAGVREATQPTKSVEEQVQERLSGDREYQDLKSQFEMWGSIVQDLNLIDNVASNGNPDGRVNLDDIKAVAQNTKCDPRAREAALRLLQNIDIFKILDKDNDNLIGIHNAKGWITGIRDALQAKEDGAREAVRSENAPRTTQSEDPAVAAPAPGTPQPDSATSTQNEEAKKVLAEANQSLPKPPPSDKTGLEGASENMNNLIGWGEAEIDRLTSLMAKTDDTAALKVLENKINQMSRRMQQMTALLNQLMTMMSNISKMYSDIAMNSIRNMR